MEVQCVLYMQAHSLLLPATCNLWDDSIQALDPPRFQLIISGVVTELAVASLSKSKHLAILEITSHISWHITCKKQRQRLDTELHWENWAQTQKADFCFALTQWQGMPGSAKRNHKIIHMNVIKSDMHIPSYSIQPKSSWEWV